MSECARAKTLRIVSKNSRAFFGNKTPQISVRAYSADSDTLIGADAGHPGLLCPGACALP